MANPERSALVCVSYSRVAVTVVTSDLPAAIFVGKNCRISYRPRERMSIVLNEKYVYFVQLPNEALFASSALGLGLLYIPIPFIDACWLVPSL